MQCFSMISSHEKRYSEIGFFEHLFCEFGDRQNKAVKPQTGVKMDA